MRILGIDPGTARLGYAIVDYDLLIKQSTLLNCGVITTCKTQEEHLRLTEIREDLATIIDEYLPELVAVEKIFFFKNPKTLVPVAQARGVVLELVAARRLKLVEFTPLEMKKLITGNGMASKELVSLIVHQQLKISEQIKPDDAVDAVGMALSATRTELWAKV